MPTVAMFALVLLLLPGAGMLPAPGGNPHNGRYCLLCHATEPRFGIDTRETARFTGKGWDDPELCLHCHKAEENIHPVLILPGPEALGTRLPPNLPLGASPGLEGRVVCTTCHFLHASDTRYALLRGFPGSQQPDLFDEWQDQCRECHADNLEKRSPHGGDERACIFCHGSRPAAGKPFSLTANAQPLCNFCHGSLQERHAEHLADIHTPSLCALCHDPHAAPGDGARQKPDFVELARNRVTLDPHYKKSLCYTCHLDRQGERYPLRMTDATSLCNRCHDSGRISGEIHPTATVPEGMKIPAGWPREGKNMNCLTCHVVGHVEDSEGHMLLRDGPYESRTAFCANCHDASRLAGRNPHEEINRKSGCKLCHRLRPNPKVDTASSVTFIADINLLCMRCHDAPSHPAGFRHTRLVTKERIGSFDGKLPLFGGRIVCATCHNPHVEQDVRHKLRLPTKGLQICAACHGQ